MENGFALKPLRTLSALSESSILAITKIADYSLSAKSYLKNVIPSNALLISS